MHMQAESPSSLQPMDGSTPKHMRVSHGQMSTTCRVQELLAIAKLR